MSILAPAYDSRVLIPDTISESGEAPKCPETAVKYALSGRAFATTWSIKLFASQMPVDLHARIQAVLDQVDREMSPYRINSDLTRFNLAPAGTFVALPPLLMTVVAHALDIAALSNGAFDPAILPAVELWGFGAKTVTPGLPDRAEIGALKTGAWRDLVWQTDGLVKPDGVRIDLCAIAKGYAVDEVVRLLRSDAAIHAALVEIGGELKGWGVQPDGLPWWVEIETPAAERTVAALCDWAVATSGEAIRNFSHDGELYSHTIDGATQAPTRANVVSATVFDPACWRADALATALTVMGEARGMAFAAHHNIPCLLWVRDGDKLREVVSPVLEAWL